MKEKGVTLIVLVITIIILAMIATVTTVKTTSVVEANKYTKFKDDLISLRESVLQVYGIDDTLENIGPKYTGSVNFLSETQGDGKTVKNPNDNDIYYVINADKLNSDLQSKFNIHLLTLNYGNNNYGITNDATTTNFTDVYIINSQSRTIYYTDGIEYKGSKYYRESEGYSKISNKTLFVDPQNISKWNKLYDDRFSFEFDNNTKQTKVTVTSSSNVWEILYVPINVTSGKTYKVSVDYINNTGSVPLNSSYQGAGFQILNKVDDLDNLSNSANTVYLSNTKSTDFQTITNTFTATQSTMYIAFNFGMLQDNSTYTYTFRNILVQEQ